MLWVFSLFHSFSFFLPFSFYFLYFLSSKANHGGIKGKLPSKSKSVHGDDDDDEKSDDDQNEDEEELNKSDSEDEVSSCEIFCFSGPGNHMRS
jgi:hypothetical protein